MNLETSSKSSFLNVADNFGEIEKGVVLSGNTYADNNEKDTGFQIQLDPLEMRNKK